MVSIEQLRCFVTVAEELHFGKAAHRLQMTQPPLSRQIQRLEHDLGLELFLRNNRQVSLTRAGQVFYPDAKRLLRMLQSSVQRVQAVDQGTVGKLTIGYTATSALSVLGTLLADIEQALPQVDVTLQEMVSRDQIQGILEGNVDLGICREVPRRAELRSLVLEEQPLVAAIPAHSPLLEQHPTHVDPASFHQQHMITYSEPDASYFNRLISSIISGYEPLISQHTTQIHSMLALVSAGRGMAIVPEVAQRFNMDGIAYRRITGWETPLVQLHAVWHSEVNNPVLGNVLQTLGSQQSNTD